MITTTKLIMHTLYHSIIRCGAHEYTLFHTFKCISQRLWRHTQIIERAFCARTAVLRHRGERALEHPN